MAILTGEVKLKAADIDEYESLRARAVSDPDINIISDNRTTLILTVYFDDRSA